MNGMLQEQYDWTLTDEYCEKYGNDFTYLREFNDGDVFDNDRLFGDDITGGCGKVDLFAISLLENKEYQDAFKIQLTPIYQENKLPIVVDTKKMEKKVPKKTRKSKKRKRVTGNDGEVQKKKRRRKKRKDVGKKHKTKGKRTLIIAEAVLRLNGGKKMKIQDILDQGIELAKVLDLKIPGGRTPERTMASDVLQDAKYNPNSVFVFYNGDRAASLKNV
jgi:hypothetical protein